MSEVFQPVFQPPISSQCHIRKTRNQLEAKKKGFMEGNKVISQLESFSCESIQADLLQAIMFVTPPRRMTGLLTTMPLQVLYNRWHHLGDNTSSICCLHWRRFRWGTWGVFLPPPQGDGLPAPCHPLTQTNVLLVISTFGLWVKQAEGMIELKPKPFTLITCKILRPLKSFWKTALIDFHHN